MRISLTENHQAIIEHNGERISFNLKDAYQSPHRSISSKPFTEINKWFNSLHHEKQTSIFNIYKEFRNELTKNSNLDNLIDNMGALSEALYTFIKYEDIKQFMISNNLIVYPKEGFLEEHLPNDPRPEKTYVASEYYDLMFFIVSLRPLFPVCTELMEKLSIRYGKDYKEYHAAITLVCDTWLFKLPQVERLISYIDVSLEGKKGEISNVVFNAMSKEDFNDWILYKIICRRLMTGELHLITGIQNQVASIYSFITNAIRQTPKTENLGNLVLKQPMSEDGADEQKSYADENRVRLNTTIGYIVRYEHFFKDIRKVCLLIDDTVPESLIKSALENRLTYGSATISRWQTVISQLILADVIHVKIMESLTKPSHVAALEIARILLWHWGHKELSLLISSEDVNSNVRYEQDSITMIPNRAREDADEYLIDKINRIYRIEDSSRKTRPKLHRVYTDLKELARTIPTKTWIVRPIPETEVPDYVDAGNQMTTPNDIINLVVKLAVELAEKRFNEILV